MRSLAVIPFLPLVCLLSACASTAAPDLPSESRSSAIPTQQHLIEAPVSGPLGRVDLFSQRSSLRLGSAPEASDTEAGLSMRLRDALSLRTGYRLRDRPTGSERPGHALRDHGPFLGLKIRY